MHAAATRRALIHSLRAALCRHAHSVPKPPTPIQLVYIFITYNALISLELNARFAPHYARLCTANWPRRTRHTDLAGEHHPCHTHMARRSRLAGRSLSTIQRVLTPGASLGPLIDTLDRGLGRHNSCITLSCLYIYKRSYSCVHIRDST